MSDPWTAGPYGDSVPPIRERAACRDAGVGMVVMTVRFRVRDLVRGRPGRRPADAGGSGPEGGELAGRVCSELALDLPDEDLGEHLHDCIDLYEMGSKPRCEEVEYLGMVQEAIDRIESGE